MNRVYLAVMVVALVVGVVFLTASVAYGQSGVDIPLDTVHRGEPGEVFLEAEISATNEIGWTCGAFLERHNNKSMHVGTNLIVESGANGVTFSNIEVKAFEDAVKAFVIDGDIRVSTQIGEDGVSSMGYLLSFECNPPPGETTTTTTTVPGTTTTTTPTVTTTEPPPINGVDTGGGAMAAQVNGQDPTILLAFGAILLTVGVLMASWVIGRKLWDLWVNGRT